MSRVDCVVAGVGGYLPQSVVTNEELSSRVETSDEWIRSRSGIGQRHFAADGESTSDIATRAAREALEHAGLSAADIDCIIVATVTPDRTFPSTAVLVQRALGAPAGPAFDVSAACSGFICGLSTACGLLRGGQARRALVIGAEKLSCFLDWSDRSTCVLFGDGGGAVILEAKQVDDDAPETGIIGSFISSNGAYADHLYADGGPSTTNTVGRVRMNGREVFRHAVEEISNAVVNVLDICETPVADVDWFVPHQANIRIIESCAKRLGLDLEDVIVTIDRHANTSSASIPLALNDAVKSGKIKRGELLVFAALGGGLAWGSALVRY